MPEERRLVTVLFADLVGSTALARENDAEIVRAALDAAFAEIAPVIDEHGGTVEKFIGDAVMAVFGIPKAHDDDAERAVRAAVAIRDLVAVHGGPLQLDVRVGVNTGEVLTRSDAGDQRLATGIAVNLAQRLQAAASPGEIVVGDLTRLLTHRAIGYGPSRQVEAKGVGMVLAWPVETLTSIVPERSSPDGARPPMVGRERELTLLREAHARVTSEHRPILVTLFGPAGIGKTRLAEEFARGLDPTRLMRGRCLPYGEGAAAYPVQRMLRGEAGIDLTDSAEIAAKKLRARVLDVVGPDDELEALQRRIVVYAGVAAAADELADVAAGDVAEELRWSFRRYVERRAASGPAVLLFEDIHWAAPALLDLIEHLADWSRAPLLLLCLARPELRETRRGWGIGREHAISIELEPLDAPATSELINSLLSVATPSEVLEREVFARSEGNPLFVEEFVRALIETGQIIRDEGRWVQLASATINVPLTLQGLIAARLDRVTGDTKRVLEEAAVIGRTFSSTAIDSLHDGSVVAALREAVAAELIGEAAAWTRGPGTIYRFRHVLFREVAYSMLPKSDRALLHDRYRQWLEDTSGERRDELIEVAAVHAEQAYRLAAEVRLPDASRLAGTAFQRLRAAADRARDRGDTRSALDVWRRVSAISDTLELSDSERLQTEETFLLLRTSFEVGDALWSKIETLLDRAREAPPTEPFVRLLLANGWRLRTSSIERSAALMDEALAAAKTLGDHELITHALLHLPVVPQARGDLNEMGHLREEALAYAKAHGVTRELSACLRALAEWALRAGAFTRAARLLDEAGDLASQTGSKAAQFAALAGQTDVATWTGPWDEAVDRAHRLEPLSADLATREARFEYLNLLGVALTEAGEFKEARSAQEAAIAMTEPESFEFAYCAFNLVFTLIALGEVRDARQLYGAVEPIDIPWQNYYAMQATVAAALDAAEGKTDAADQLYRAALAIFQDATTAPTQWRRAQQLHAQLLLRVGRLDEAQKSLKEVREFFSDPLAAPRRARVDALLAATEQAQVERHNVEPGRDESTRRPRSTS
jgi:class 3 adenylate cyclase/tetratricopeptide (TPR) repeat protein